VYLLFCIILPTTFNFDEFDEEEIASKQDIGTVQGFIHKYTVFHQNDAEYKTMSGTEKPEVETEVSIPTRQPKVIVPQKINKGLFTPNLVHHFNLRFTTFILIKVVFKKSLN